MTINTAAGSPYSARAAQDSGAELDTRLGELLVASGILSREQLEKSLDTSLSSFIPIGRTLLLTGIIDEDLLNAAVEIQRRLRAKLITLNQAIQSLYDAQKCLLKLEQAQKFPFIEAPQANFQQEQKYLKQQEIINNLFLAANFVEALPILREVSLMLEKNDPQSEYLIEVYDKSADAYSAMSENIMAASMWAKVLKLKTEKFGCRDRQLVTTLIKLARVKYLIGRFEASESYSKQLIDLLEIDAVVQSELGLAIYNLALVHHSQKRYVETELQYKRAMEILYRTLGPNHSATVNLLSDYARMLRELDREEEAAHFDACVNGIVVTQTNWL